MRNSLFALASSLLLATALAPNAPANLVTDPYFTNLTYSGSKTLTTYYGQFGTGTGSTLTFANWSTSGYNFVYAPGTADAGTSTGANTGAPNEAPGQYNASNGYGNTYLYGTNNGGASNISGTYPGGGNYVAADGAFQTGAITQTINGLVSGKSYTLSFYWAAAQQQGFAGATTENWQVSLGTQTFTTPTFNLAAKSFSGWMQQTFTYTATGPSETLSFLAAGTPNGQPPFSLLGGVNLNAVPEPSAWALFVGCGAAATAFGVVHRRRQRAACLPVD